MKNSALRLGYFADGPWAHQAFQKIIADSRFEVAFVCLRWTHQDPVLKQMAEKAGIHVFSVPKINAPDVLEKLRGEECRIFVSMSFDQIFKADILKIAPLGIINCHAGKLPFYRGRNILNWALINDEKELGVTVHHVDTGIDTGDIILQKCTPITDEDDYASLHAKAVAICADLLYESLVQIQEGRAKRIVQSTIHPVGMYCAQRKPGDEILNWNQTSREIFNFVRAIAKPGPRATTKYLGQDAFINRVIEVKDSPQYKGTPGQILGKGKNGWLVKTKDSFVEVLEIEVTGGAVLRPGERFG
ncbi:MAG: methionyl-tRNA formyltransferase [Bdellovibrionales bacterium]|nr:methionyl-tRNA formyltransferase [Bdellovibrionales bacterium]